MKLTIGFSPCPNDTFIFDAMVHHKVDTEGLEFEYRLEDVETLNRLAMAGQLDISKISFGALPLVLHNYQVLNSGGALGKGVGPLLVAKREMTADQVNQSLVVLPGKHTTAHLLFSLAYPEAGEKAFIPFDRIEEEVLKGDAGCGVIIHENRFTYASRGLVKLADLGEVWEERTKQPIPLGGIIVRRSLGKGLAETVDRVIRRSLEYAFAHLPELPSFVKEHAQEMEESVMRQHIELYVNEHSLDLGAGGKAAVWQLLMVSSKLHPEPTAGSFEVFI
jgi:1,4-dihydroxy-6-naphthoate synthase